ncbi:nitrite reductase [Pluteus cervinus]|uniref:Nitrite reductase n=1 Tax=Pluteus cervinus TaxID=181527 RepID=A0ACD3BA75_9AGAR|nr:nitrite reductase [Pluteus cervinus]
MAQNVVVIGFGMTGIAFVEKLLKYDKEEFDGKRFRVTIIGDEPYLAYNRVGLTQYFAHRAVEKLYMNPLEWYQSQEPGRLTYRTGERVLRVDIVSRRVFTDKDRELEHDICVFATGSRPSLPSYLSWPRVQDTRGVFVYRTISDLEEVITFAAANNVSRASVVGGGLLGLEAANALKDLGTIPSITILERNEWVLSRQIDSEGGKLLLEQIKALNIDVLVKARTQDLVTTQTDQGEFVQGLLLDDGQIHNTELVIFAVGITPRDELAKASGLDLAPRGGILVQDDLSTSSPGVYAIGECASWKGETYGLIAPGVEMAEILAYNLTVGQTHKLRSMTPPDLSTRLKVLGINVACFGDYFADKKPPHLVDIPGHRKKSAPPTEGPVSGGPVVRELCYHDPFSYVYKKYVFSKDGQYLLGGILLGDLADYAKLVSIVKKRKPLEHPPGQLILGVPRKEGESDGDDLDDDAQVCSCYNVSKGAIVKCVSEGCNSFGELKAKTKISTGCGGCAPLATSIFNKEMKKAGHTITNYLCIHFKLSRQDLFMIVKVKKLKTFSEVMHEAGANPHAIGCEVCKPAIGSILASLHNEFILQAEHHQIQDTNDKYLANIQRNGTYSVVPRVPAGEITPAKLRALGEVGEKYGLYTKITGGQRIDMFGASKQDLPSIWEELGTAGFESGHAYGKALRTVKSCVGTTWCRYGVGDSVGLAVELEQRYKGIRAPHKFKGGVSGCVRECAEAQGKDFGVIATSKGWNVYVGGNGGAKPRHADLLAADVSKKRAVQLIDRFLMLYIQSADRLQRTARWIEALSEGGGSGLEYLKRVIVQDSLGICAELDKAMEALVGTYFDEWAEVVRNPEKRALFRQFVNTEETKKGSELEEERGQTRPVMWPDEETPLKFHRDDVADVYEKWNWVKVARLEDLRPTAHGSTSIVVNYSDTQIAIFKLENGQLYATQQLCPHRRAFVLSDGLVGDTADGKPYISCPLHKRNFLLEGGECVTDERYKILTFEVKEDNGAILLKLPEARLLDDVLSTSKWMLRKTKALPQVEIVGPNGQILVGGADSCGDKPTAVCQTVSYDW